NLVLHDRLKLALEGRELAGKHRKILERAVMDVEAEAGDSPLPRLQQLPTRFQDLPEQQLPLDDRRKESGGLGGKVQRAPETSVLDLNDKCAEGAVQPRDRHGSKRRSSRRRAAAVGDRLSSSRSQAPRVDPLTHPTGTDLLRRVHEPQGRMGDRSKAKQ